jgi:hypothetical protein
MAKVSAAELVRLPPINRDHMKVRADEIMKITESFTAHPEFKKMGDMSWEGQNLRNQYTNLIGWSVPSKDATDCILSYVGTKPVLSLAAGNGAQETLLAARGGNVVCADIEPPTSPWMLVDILSNDDAVATWRAVCPCVMIVWPELCDRWGRPVHEPPPDCPTYKALFIGNFEIVVYIGEKDGCTGSPQLDSFLEKNYTLLKEHSIPQWPGIHDSLRIYERKTRQVVAVPKPRNSWETWKE